MKAIRLSLAVAIVSVWAGTAMGQSYSFTVNPGATIPDANGAGYTSATNVSGILGTISDISLTLNLTNAAGSTAYNGDLYAYLVGPNGGFSILLNRSGVTSGNSFGYNNTGFNVTFALTGSDIHFYQNFTPSYNGAGQLIGSWLPDGRAIDPQSAPGLFDSTSSTALLDSFLGTDPNGTWIMFFADLAGGNVASVPTWTLNITTVPEPSTWALMFLAGAALIKSRRVRKI